MNGFESVLPLVQSRWQLWNQFDLEESQWLALLETYSAPVVLEAVKSTRNIRESDPAFRYERFIKYCEKLAQSAHRTI